MSKLRIIYIAGLLYSSEEESRSNQGINEGGSV